MLRYAHKAPLKLSHFCRTFQAPPGGYNKKKPTIQAAFETVNRGFSFGALEGTRIPGPLIKRIKGASFVKFQKFEEALFLSYHRKTRLCTHRIICIQCNALQPLSSYSGVQKVCKNVQSQNQPLKTGIGFLCKAGKPVGFEPKTAAEILPV